MCVCVAIQIKTIEQYYHVVLMVHCGSLAFESVDEILVMKAIEQYIHLVLPIT